MRNSFSFWLLMNRKFFGISFAILHLIHLLFLLLLQKFFHPVFDLAAGISLMAGGMAYVFVVLMLLTSFDYFKSKLSPKAWKTLHTVGAYWIWMIFMSTNWKAVFRADYDNLIAGLTLVFVVLLRVYTFWKK